MALSRNSPHPLTEPFHIGDRLRKARIIAGYNTVSEFASVIGIHRDTLAKYEDGITPPKRMSLIAVAWHSPARLEWIETGEMPFLKSEADGSTGQTGKAPTPRGGGPKLPGLDSNQEPAGFKPGNVIFVDFAWLSGVSHGGAMTGPAGCRGDRDRPRGTVLARGG